MTRYSSLLPANRYQLSTKCTILSRLPPFNARPEIILIAFFQQSISPRIANHQFADVGLQQVS